VEVDPEASALRVGGARVESQWGRAIIVPLRSRAETVTVPTGVIERTGVLPKEVSAEVVESAEVADEGGSWVPSVMGSSLVSGVMSDDLLGDWVRNGTYLSDISVDYSRGGTVIATEVIVDDLTL